MEQQNSPDHTAMVSAEFQHAFEYSLRLREDHGGNVRSAFVEFAMEPDIVWHWNELGTHANADLLMNAASMISQMQNALGGTGVEGLPGEIKNNTEYKEAVHEAKCLVDMGKVSLGDPLHEECVRVSETRSTQYVIYVFAALLMSAFAPAPTGGTE